MKSILKGERQWREDFVTVCAQTARGLKRQSPTLELYGQPGRGSFHQHFPCLYVSFSHL